MKLSTQILLAFSVILLLSVIDSASNYLLSLKVEQNGEFLNKSQEIIRNSGKLHQSIVEMQSAFRGYLLTGDTSFLEGYNDGLKNVPVLFTEQKKLIGGNIHQMEMLDSISSLNVQWIEYSTSLIEANKKKETSEASRKFYVRLFESKLKGLVGKKINDNIAQKFLAFDRSEYKLRSIHSTNLNSSIQQTHIISFTFFALTIIIGISSTIFVVRLISKRIKTMVRLADNISKGNFTTVKDEHRDELTSLSSSLNIMSDSLNSNIRELKKKNEELDKFAYVVSHDLKAPVRGIHNVVTWIEEDLSNELSVEMKKYIDIIHEKTKRMEDLINGLLDYARLRAKTPPEKTNVKDMINEIIQTTVPKNFKVETTNLPTFYTERIKLEQVFTNLISNAVKYTPHENGWISISCNELSGLYQFSVRDNGIGIEPQYHNKVFEMFQTLREKNEKESTGIGLAIIKKIIDDLHCSIKVNSELGKGTEFVFTWPR